VTRQGEFAIIGMAGRFPGAPDIQTFWANLKAGVESRTVFTDEDLKAAGATSQALSHPKLVRSGFVLEDADLFDAAFFGINPREAELLDPQHRIFLECAWEVLEHAGYDPEAFPGNIGVFGGATLSSYLISSVLRNPSVVQSAGPRQAVYGSVPDFMITRVAYKLNLRGPAFFVQSACSTSLVAVHLACQSLANHECDMVLAGGVSVTVPQRGGYLYEEGGMLSPDGILRAFDSRSRGTVFGSGVGIVLLKRLDDAIAARDTIQAVIKGVAVTNDGSLKVGFTAPGLVGQSHAIAEALATSGLSADSISYVEAHGTGTELGDPIEIAALTKAFRATTDRRHFCMVGSVKPNIGHLDAAAGVTSLIKTVLALKHRQIPPTINFENPNPKVDFEDSPFYVNTTLQPWPADGGPRRAGVSSFGFGGTNAHVIVEEAPEPVASGPSRSRQVLVLAARTEAALEAATDRLAESLHRQTLPLADVAYTLALGRRHFAHRRAVVCGENEDAADLLQARDPRRTFTARAASTDRSVVFMFPGQGAQYVNMGADLYREEPLFRQIVDECAAGLLEPLGADIRELMYPADPADPAAAERLKQTSFTQAALFTIEYALARLWMSWGIRPAAMIGHSIGELVAACLAGVFSLQDALRVVATRGRLMEQMPTGTMAAVPLKSEEVQRSLIPGVWLAAVNAPSLCVVSGRSEAIDEYVAARAREGVECRRLHTSHAFHSGLMDAAVPAFAEVIAAVERHAPQMPFVSNVTGTWITAEEATDPQYWAGHIRRPVAFSEGVSQVRSEPDRILLEVGPGNTLSALVRQQAAGGGHLVVSSLRHPQEQTSDVATVLGAVARLWVSGAAVNWTDYFAGELRRRVPLPSYPFERQRFWVEPEPFSPKKFLFRVGMMQRENFSDWFHALSWKRTAATAPLRARAEIPCLLFDAESPICSRLADRLAASAGPVLRVRMGERFARVDDATWTVDPASPADHAALIKDLLSNGGVPPAIVHAWTLTGEPLSDPSDEAVDRVQQRGFFSLLHLAQALGSAGVSSPTRLSVLTDGVQEVDGNEVLVPEKATIVGPCRVIAQEFSNIACTHVDLAVADAATTTSEQLDSIVADLGGARPDIAIAYRRGRRWTQTCDVVRFDEVADAEHPRLRAGGTYLITGGLGGIGLVLAEHLAEHYKARLVLTGRRGLPPRDQWGSYVSRGADDPTARRIALVQRLESLGADVMVADADVVDESRMRQAVTAARDRFGSINGVIHSAGIAGGGMIQLKKRDVAAAVLAPKVYGARVLARIFRDQPLDFMLLCSSMASLLGGVGQVDYCGANAYLDTFARQYGAETGTFTVSVNWNAWREVGMAVDTSVPEDLRESLKGAMLSSGITNHEGVEAFRRILARSTEAQIAVSPNDLGLLSAGAVLREDEKFSAGERPSTSGSTEVAQATSAPPATGAGHPRPALQTPFVAPRNGLETKLCAIWQELLGIDRIGVEDNFFELGGHSLLAIRVMARLNETLKTDIPVAKLYDGLTVAFLAGVAQETGGEKADAAQPDDSDGDDRRRDRARRQREQQARRREAMREMTRT
jgi:acyl transferase domain-containing protein